ncbi:MAG: hypothetical protein AB7O66_16975 [Limisphaerales bacterium]
MADPFRWIWIVNTDVIRQRPSEERAVVALNLNTLGWAGDTVPAAEPPDELRFPWRDQAIHGFDLWWVDPLAAGEERKIDPAGYLPFPASTLTPLDELTTTYERVHQGLESGELPRDPESPALRGRRLPKDLYVGFNANSTDAAAGEASWSGVLSDLSQKGFPLAHSLRLAFLFDPHSDPGFGAFPDSTDTSGRRLAVTPRFQGWSDLQAQGTASRAANGTEVRLKVTFKPRENPQPANAAPDPDSIPAPAPLPSPAPVPPPVGAERTPVGPLPPPLEIRVEAAPVAGPSLVLPDFVSIQSDRAADGFEDWRSPLSRRLGVFVQPLRWLRAVLVATNGGFPPTAAVLRRQVEFLLSVAHARNDLGLRQPAWERSRAFGQSGPVTTRGSLIHDTLRFLHAEGRLGPRVRSWADMERDLDQLAQAGVGSNLLLPTFNEWAGLLADALNEVPFQGPATATATPGPESYPKLQALLRWYLANPVPAGPNLLDPVDALDELDRALVDEAVLLASWIRQWDSVFDRALPALTWFLQNARLPSGASAKVWEEALPLLTAEESIALARTGPVPPEDLPLLWSAAARLLQLKPNLRSGTPPEVRWLVGDWRASLPRLAPHRDAVLQWLSTTGTSLAQRYVGGVVGEYLARQETPPAVDVPDPTPPAPMEPEEVSFRQGEGRDAARWLTGAFIDFNRRLTEATQDNALAFLKATGFPTVDAANPSPDGILGKLLWHDEVHGPALPGEQPGSVRRAWVDGLVGRTRMQIQPPRATPSPLLIPLPAGFDDARYAGLLVLARRYSQGREAATSTDWCLLTIGDMALCPTPKPRREEGKPERSRGRAPNDRSDERFGEDVAMTDIPDALPGMKGIPVPWRIFNSHGINLLLLSYQGRPLGVDLWETFEEWPGPEVDAGGRPVPTPHLRQHLPESPEDWGAIPGRRYGRDFVFEFLLPPVHNIGVLPAFLQDGSAAGSDRYCRLNDAVRVRQALRAMEANYASKLIRIRAPLRRVPVGQPRLAAPAPRTSTGTFDPRNWPVFREYASPRIPRDVRPLAADILEEQQAGGPRPPGDSLLPPENRKPPAQIVLLTQPVDSVETASEFRFHLRPPAAEIENWSIWQSSVLEDGLTPAHADFIGDVRRISRDLARLVDEAKTEPPGFGVSELLDDPAVEGFLLRIRTVLPAAQCGPVAEHENEVFVELAQGVGERAGWNWFSEADALGELAFGMAFPSDAVATSGIGIRPWVQRVAGEFRVGKGTVPAMVELCRRSLATPGIHREGSRILVDVPAGSILELEVLPCVREAEFENRFGTHRGRDETERMTFSGDPWRAIRTSATRIWLEAVDWVADDARSGSRQRLLPKTVWHGLRLGGVGEFSEGARRKARLETALIPFPEDLRAWTFYSEVRFRIQAWRWLGLPEDSPEELACLLAPSPGPGEPPSDTVQKYRERLIRGELPSFAERSREDSLDSEATDPASVEPSASSSIRPKINFVGNLIRQLADPLTPILPAVVFQDSGEQERIARHYRVEVEVRHRYAGLHSSPNDQSVRSLLRWPNAQGQTISTPYRRITFRGRLAERPDPPRIKFAVPLMESIPGAPGDRPGFLALARETLQSPFHRLIARIQWTRLETSPAGSRSDPGIILELPEFGPDPLTSREAFRFTDPAGGKETLTLESEGSAFGLTTERIAGNAAYPNAGFHFNAPRVSPATAEEFGRHDWFARFSFRWEIRPGYVLDQNASQAYSDSTIVWTVRLLAPFTKLRICSGLGDPEPSEIKSLRFSRDPGSGQITFQKSGDAAGSVQPLPPVVLSEPRMDQSTRSPLEVLLMFASWTVVPDAANPSGSKALRSLHLIVESSPDPIPVINSTSVDPGHASGDRLPMGGNFVLVLTRREHRIELIQSLAGVSKKEDRDNERSEILGEFLFSTKSKDLDQDVRAMIVATSACIHGD